MRKHLFFVCPTDSLEAIIEQSFEQENYFFTSLANSIRFDESVCQAINRLLEAKSITDISFVLSADNYLILDALSYCDYRQLKGLACFYSDIQFQKIQCNKFWKRKNLLISVLSYFLFSKMNQLYPKINRTEAGKLRIDCQIYYKSQGIFKEAYPSLFRGKIPHLN
jgi:hypothetical protein